VRILAAIAVCALFGQAPLQCASDPEPELRRYETPGEALYDLATQFKAKGDEKAWRTTLEYLIARYPNSRHAEMARTDLAEEKGGS
jgi:outer membrane protein assembly factor BamD (BamD/ComL family)